MPFLIKVDDDHTVSTDQFTWDVADAIEVKYDVPWADVMFAPVKRLAIGIEVWSAAARLAGLSDDEVTKRAAAFKPMELVRAFEWVEDDLPVEYTDGVPPKADAASTAG